MSLADRFPNTSVIGRILRLPLRAINLSRPLRIIKGPMRGLIWLPKSTNAGVWLGTYERLTMDRIAAAVGRGAVFYDIGANVGVYSILAASRPASKVFSFEPVPANVAVLLRHVVLNRLTNVRPFEVALSDHNGTVHFSTAAGMAEGRIAEKGDLIVRSATLDSIVMEQHLPLPTFIKLDVEGAGRSVLDGGENTIRAAMPTMFCAIHNGTDERVRVREKLEAMGYAIEEYDPDPDEGYCNTWWATPRFTT